LTIFFNESDSFGSFRENYETALAAFFHVANFHFADTFGNRASGVTFVYWSLSLEEQFYLIFPFLILLSGKRLPYVLAMAIFLQLVIDRGFIMIVTRTDALCFGILIALWSQKESYTQFKPMFLVKKRLATIIFLLIMTLGLAAMDSNGIKLVGQDLKYSVIAVMSAILVFIASHNNDIFSSALGKLSKVIVWVGSRSYAIYLIHIPAFLLSREIWFRLSGHGTLFDEQFFYQYLITAFVLIVALAELNFRLVEQPLRRKGKHIADSYMKSQAHKKNQ
jgi:peptidoglycan/LPS O-acetylase OafA/YrhL